MPFFGQISDKTGRFWLLTFIGYGINLLSVPAMALAGHWWVAAALMLSERIGRGMRKPSVETMLSYTTQELGKGWVYAVNNALDETGAALGPLLVALVLMGSGSYRMGFAVLLASAVLAVGTLAAARIGFPLPSKLEVHSPSTHIEGFVKSYWLYMAAGTFFAAGLTSFELISVHLLAHGVVPSGWLPVYLSIATVGGIFASLVLGRLFDRAGIVAVVLGVVLSALFSPLVFFGGPVAVLVGLLLWGVGYATQDTLLKAVIASVLPRGKRNLAFGLFYTGYGSGWLLGSIATGLLYEPSRVGLVVFCVACQLASVPLFDLGRTCAAPAATRS